MFSTSNSNITATSSSAFSSNLSFVMSKRTLLKADLHRLTGISNSYLSVMLSPKGNASLDKIKLVANALHIPIFVLFLPKPVFRYILTNSEIGHPISATDALQLIARKYNDLGTDKDGCSAAPPTG